MPSNGGTAQEAVAALQGNVAERTGKHAAPTCHHADVELVAVRRHFAARNQPSAAEVRCSFAAQQLPFLAAAILPEQLWL